MCEKRGGNINKAVITWKGGRQIRGTMTGMCHTKSSLKPLVVVISKEAEPIQMHSKQAEFETKFGGDLSGIKVTRHVCFKNSKNLRLLDILACDSANKPSFQNLTKSLFVQWSIDVKSAVTF